MIPMNPATYDYLMETFGPLSVVGFFRFSAVNYKGSRQ